MKMFSNKRTLLITAVCALFIFFVIPHLAHAADGDSWWSPVVNALNPLTWLSKILEFTVLPLAAGMLGVVGSIFDTAVKFSLSTSYIFSNIDVINETWKLVRDICNLFFIFALIWISISIILSSSGFNAKRRLGDLIVAALVINFSLYFTKVFVDVSNIFGNWLYSGILASISASAASSFSALIASKLDIYYLWNPLDGAALVKNLTTSAGIVTVVLRLLVVLTATYVFMYTAILFITRAVTIIFLLILSPIGFVGGLLPQLEEYSKKWWHELTDAVTFPIIYLLLLYITLQLTSKLTGSSVWGGFFATGTIMGIDIGKTFKYIIVIAALLICLKIAKDSAGQLGKAASGVAGSLGKLSTAIGGGGAALVGQYTVGAGAARLANNKWLNEKIAAGGLSGAALSSVKGGLSSTADFHFDPRTTISEFGVKGGKGYTSRMKDQTKEQEEAMKTIAAGKKEKDTVKEELTATELSVYGEHPKYGDIYRDKKATLDAQQNILNTSTNRAEKEKALKALNKAKSDLDDAKTLIDSDETVNEKGEKYDAQKKLYEARTDMLRGGLDSKKKAAMEEVLRQERAAQAAGRGIGVSLARGAAGEKPIENASIPEKVTRIVGQAGTIVTLGAGRLAGQQYSGDTAKGVKKLREVMKGDESTKEQDKIMKMLARMTGEDKPAEPAKKDVPEIYTGSSSNPPRSTKKYS